MQPAFALPWLSRADHCPPRHARAPVRTMDQRRRPVTRTGTDVGSQQPLPVARAPITNKHEYIKSRKGASTWHRGCELRPEAAEPAAFAGHRPVRGLHCASTASVLHLTSFRTCDQRPRRHLSTPRLVLKLHTHGGQSAALRSRGRSRVTSNRSLRPMEHRGTRSHQPSSSPRATARFSAGTRSADRHR